MIISLRTNLCNSGFRNINFFIWLFVTKIWRQEIVGVISLPSHWITIIMFRPEMSSFYPFYFLDIKIFYLNNDIQRYEYVCGVQLNSYPSRPNRQLFKPSISASVRDNREAAYSRQNVCKRINKMPTSVKLVQQWIPSCNNKNSMDKHWKLSSWKCRAFVAW